MNDLAGKRFVVTGASSGIGEATAQMIAAKGGQVIALGRRRPAAPVAQYIEADIGDPASIDAAVAQISGKVGGICNFAGLGSTQPGDMIARVNYLGLRHLVDGLVQKIEAGGVIVNCASSSGALWRERLAQHLALAKTGSFAEGLNWIERNPAPEKSYGYFKEALIVWSMLLAPPYKSRYGIRVNCVSPGPIETPILDEVRAMRGAASLDDSKRRAGIGMPVDVANTVEFLISGRSSWIVGADIPVDGGLVASKQMEMVN